VDDLVDKQLRREPGIDGERLLAVT